MGFLLSGATAAASTSDPNLDRSLSILYADEALIAVDKPAGLLSVPGRTRNRQDSVLSRLRCQYSEDNIQPVHRLDQATSGILVLARHPAAQRRLSEQFQQHRVTKQYEAIVIGTVTPETGKITLPLWGDPSDRPRQSVNFQQGKPSHTDYRVLQPMANHSRIEFHPVTGRTHQLRVHAAQGLNAPILGDRLYGPNPPALRLYLHAKTLILTHPQQGIQILLSSPVPF